jgi:acyl-CoA reductase-like NAD-dependent aldehyde dehydrogenase
MSTGSAFDPQQTLSKHMLQFTETLPVRIRRASGLNLQVAVPFGGDKESGIGRVGGTEGLEAYQEIKSIYMPA